MVLPISACSDPLYIRPVVNSCPPSSESEEYINPSESSSLEEPGESSSSEEPIDIEPVYDEEPDSVEGIDVTDLSDLFNAFNDFGDNYTTVVKGYFNEIGSYDYYRHYQQNYVCDKTNYYLGNVQYTMPELDAYLSVCNSGYVNYRGNYYKFSLNGSSKEERLNSVISTEDLTDEVVGKKYQDDLFTIEDLDEDYFTANEFTRISEKKYQYTSTNSEDVYLDFIDICAPGLINQGHYLTFSRVTIELNPDDDNLLRIRLYVSSTQSGKLIDSHNEKEDKPNWYMLFSEAYIFNKGNTAFAPADGLVEL